MLIKRAVNNCDGKGSQIVEVEVPDPAPEEISARRAARDARMAARKQPKPA